jgi:hypothetical protein
LNGERHSEQWLARKLGVARELLIELAERPERHYRSFIIQPPGKKPRPIDNPDEDLKTAQREIRFRLLAPLRLPEHVHGCVKRRSPVTNAIGHCGQVNVASIDIKDFYPSVTNRSIYELWLQLGYGFRVASMLTRLTTYRGHLPQGSPTSDALANHVLAPVDARLVEIARGLNLKLSRYLDNIDLSGVRTREAIPMVIEVLRDYGYGVRHKKTFNVGPRTVHVVTGYTVNNADVPSVCRKEQRRIRSAAHEVIREHREGRPVNELLRRLSGRMAYLRQTNPGAAASISRQLKADGIDERALGVRRPTG